MMWCETCRLWFDSVDGECPVCSSSSVDADDVEDVDGGLPA